jgi:hypothetical protein
MTFDRLELFSKLFNQESNLKAEKIILKLSEEMLSKNFKS